MTTIDVKKITDSLDLEYEMAMLYLNSQFETYPTKLLEIPITEAEQAEISYYDALGRWVANNA